MEHTTDCKHRGEKNLKNQETVTVFRWTLTESEHLPGRKKWLSLKIQQSFHMQNPILISNSFMS